MKFNFETREIDHCFFDRCMWIPQGRYWDEPTRSWWMKQRSTLETISARMEDPRLVMESFWGWAGGASCRLHFLSKPLSFDFPFVQSYFRHYGPEGHVPFDFRLGRDLRSMMHGIAPDFDEKSVPFEGTQHNALFDALHQIKLLFAAKDHAHGRRAEITGGIE